MSDNREKIAEFPNSSRVKFSDTEKQVLLSLVEEVRDVIENPKTDSSSKQMKNNAWQLIAEEYAVNSADYGIFVQRTADQLKRCWENLKYKCRKADSEEKQYMLKTGGGPSMPQNPEENFHEQVRKIVPHINLTLENPYDSTSRLEGKSDSYDDDLEFEIEYLDEKLLKDVEADFTDKSDLNAQSKLISLKRPLFNRSEKVQETLTPKASTSKKDINKDVLRIIKSTNRKGSSESIVRLSSTIHGNNLERNATEDSKILLKRLRKISDQQDNPDDKSYAKK